jgi:hypothetical protein
MSKRQNNTWSTEDRQAFSDRNILRARSVPAKRNDGPNSDEWDEED